MSRRRPNILVVLTDDQGPWAMPNRMPELDMPHLSDLLDDGLELSRAYCASPVCSPSRASLLTGWMPSAHGVHDWLVGERHPDAKPDQYLDGVPTTPEVLAEAGYQCAHAGKWHVGDARLPAPGFEYWYAHRFGGGPYFDAPIWRDGEEAVEPRYFTHAVTEQALDFLRERDPERPFYLQVHYTAPHTPWLDNHPEEYTSRYDGCTFPSVPREEPHPWTLPRREDFRDAVADPEPHLRGYCASLSAVDEGLGQLRSELRRQGVDDDTVVVYLSDNGFSCGHHGIWGKGNGTWPLNFWENSVRVPFVIRVPDGARGASEALVSAAALHPTLCELAGVDLPCDALGAATSMAALTRGEPFRGEDLVVVTSEYGGARMLTDGQWKLVQRADGPDELYDLVADPRERVNLADDPAQAERRRGLERALAAWFARHERAGASGFGRDVRGHGQVHPVWRGYPDERTYMATTAPDGVVEPSDASAEPAD